MKLRFLGFDSTAIGSDYEVNLSKHEVVNLSFIDPLSQVLRDRIEHLAQDKSRSYLYVKNHGPFDVVNIDLCDCLAGIGKDSYFEAMKQLFILQTMGRTKPWILLLATRTVREQIEETTKTKLLQCILHNIDNDAGFATVLHDALGLDRQILEAEMRNGQQLTHVQLVHAFVLGIGKWMLQLLMSGRPKVLVEMSSGYSYRVHMGEPDMVSLAFRVKPMIELGVDQSGITASAGSHPVIPTEPELAKGLVGQVRSIVDIDAKLAGDPNGTSISYDNNWHKELHLSNPTAENMVVLAHGGSTPIITGFFKMPPDSAFGLPRSKLCLTHCVP